MHKLSTIIRTWNVLSLLAWGEFTAFSFLIFDFYELAAPYKAIYLDNIALL